jgi:hypothetical protein
MGKQLIQVQPAYHLKSRCSSARAAYPARSTRFNPAGSPQC